MSQSRTTRALFGAGEGAAGALAGAFAQSAGSDGTARVAIRLGGAEDDPNSGLDIAPSLMAAGAGMAIGLLEGQSWRGVLRGGAIGASADSLAQLLGSQIAFVAPDPSMAFDYKRGGVGAVLGLALGAVL